MKNIQIIGIGFLLFSISCSKKEETKTEKPVFANETVVAVQLAAVDSTSRSEAVVAAGLVASTNEARLSFKTGGVINRIFVKEGQRVNRGQLLATLDMTEINAQVSQAQYGLDKADRDFRRVGNMFKDTAATREQMQNATTGRDVAQQTLQIARFNQEFSRIVSPMSGVIIKKMANEGELAGPGSPILFLNSSQSGNWVVRVGVTDKDWARLALGNPATITIDAYPEESFAGTISELAPIADPMSKMYEVEIKIATNGQKLASGMFAKIELSPTQSRSYAVVPIEAIIEGNGKNAFVFVLDQTGKKVKKIPVTVGFIENNKVLITSGLEGISKVVTSGGAFLSEGAMVKIKSVE